MSFGDWKTITAERWWCNGCGEFLGTAEDFEEDACDIPPEQCPCCGAPDDIEKNDGAFYMTPAISKKNDGVFYITLVLFLNFDGVIATLVIFRPSWPSN